MTDNADRGVLARGLPSRRYPKPAGGAPDFPALELEVLDYWARDDTFRASIARRDGAQEYVFYDGPPFANGLPHYGHLLTGYVKDIVPRYRTMRGYKVERRFGWDTHGLPAELEVRAPARHHRQVPDRRHGHRRVQRGVPRLGAAYTDEWRAYVTRQARWVDFDNDYKTLDLPYMESVIWAFKQLWDKGLAYEGYRVLPYCWRDETPLSNHELRMDDDVYQSRQDPAITVGFKITGGALDGGPPAGLDDDAVDPAVEPGGRGQPRRDLRRGQGRRPSFRAGAGPAGRLRPRAGRGARGARHLSSVRTCSGRVTCRRSRISWTPPTHFRCSPATSSPPRTAPASCTWRRPTARTTWPPPTRSASCRSRRSTPRAASTRRVPDYQGQHVFDANAQIIRDLKNGSGPAAANGAVLIRHETYEHPYPHCWRCRNPLIYRAVSSWFVTVTEFRDRMVELNQQITWHPEHVKDGQFGKWLQGARDWSISRNRYWGTPIPVWKSDDPAYPRIDVYGSLDELERDFGVRPTNLHRPYIDELTRPNPDDPTGRSTMRRIPDVLDVWFDSGSMPYAQVHYPFENGDWFDGHYPGDFIVEYIGQTRGWFYTLHVLATALFDRPAFKTCVAHGIVLGSDGQKMSKSLRNYPDVTEVFDRDGSDAMRWFLMASPILRGGNLIVTEQGIREGVRQVLLPLWNAYSFLALYAPKVGTWRTDSAHVLDRYILAKLAALRDDLTAAMEVCDISGPASSCASSPRR